MRPLVWASKPYQTEPETLPHSTGGSDGSSVEPTVVPLTLAGRLPRLWKLPRLSFAGADAASVAPGPTSRPAKASSDVSRRASLRMPEY